MKKKIQVFLSSTYTDLLDERQAAVAAILKAGHIPAGMELFTAGDKSQFETICRWIDESDVFMLILGGRYGSIEPKSKSSYIELEYNYAVEKKKPLFAVIITEDALERRVKQHGSSVLEKEHPDQYKHFRDKVLGKMTAFYEDPKDIKLAVHETLAGFIDQYSFSGWVSGSDVPDTKPLLDEIKQLRLELDKCRLQSAEIQKRLERSTPASPSTDEMRELIDTIDSVEINAKALKKETDNNKLPDKIPLINLFFGFKENLITGVTNKYGISEVQRFLYFNVCPRLQVYGLVKNEKIPGVQYRRFAITEKGTKLIAYIEKNKLLKIDE